MTDLLQEDSPHRPDHRSRQARERSHLDSSSLPSLVPVLVCEWRASPTPLLLAMACLYSFIFTATALLNKPTVVRWSLAFVADVGHYRSNWQVATMHVCRFGTGGCVFAAFTPFSFSHRAS